MESFTCDASCMRVMCLVIIAVIIIVLILFLNLKKGESLVQRGVASLLGASDDINDDVLADNISIGGDSSILPDGQTISTHAVIGGATIDYRGTGGATGRFGSISTTPSTGENSGTHLVTPIP